MTDDTFDANLIEEQDYDCTFVGDDTFDTVFLDSQDYDCTFVGDDTFDVDLGNANIDQYQGAYEVTPTEEEQVLVTVNKAMAQNVTIAPIPSNYGLITWDGTTITVS